VKCKNRSDTKTTVATGTIQKSFRKYLSNIPGKHEIELQETTTMGTAHSLRKLI
jgi:hypothetical protein